MSSGSSMQPKDKDLTVISRSLQGTQTGVLKKTNYDSWSLDANLYSIGNVTPTDSVFLVGNGSSWVGESGTTARTSLGLGDSATLSVGTTVGTVAAGDHTHLLYEKFHGVESIGALSFDNSTHILTIAAATNKYWFQGTSYTTAGAITCDLDSYVTLTTNTLYYIFFDAAAGVLKASSSVWGLKTHVPIATLFWNGTAGAPVYEAHNHTRDLDWHAWAHMTVGARYGSGLSLVTPTTVSDASLSIGSGTIYDEDIAFTVTAQTVARVLYKVSASVYTYVDTSLPYAGASADPKYLDTDTYTLTSAGDSTYLNMWVYAVPDISRPIYIIPTHASTTYNTISTARSETPPNLGGLNLSPEMTLIYRFTYRGDGQFQEFADYRNSSSTTAAAVSFTPSGDIVATTVQTAIEELDSEKQPLDGDLTAIAALVGTTGLLKKTAADTWTLDTSAYSTTTGTVTSVGGTGSYGGLTLTGTVTTTGNLTLGGTPTGTWPISVSGNAATVTNGLYTNTTFGGDVSGAYNAIVVADNSHSHTSANISDATNANTVNMIVKRDASGNFSAGTITAALTGNCSGSSSRISFSDRRAVVQTPDYFGAGADWSFMQNSTDGLSDGGTFHGVLHYQPYSDASGGGAYELGFTDNNNMWLRGSSGALTSWAAWKKIWDSSNLTNLNQLTNGPGYTTNTGTVTGVTGTAPVVSSGGTAPAISMAAATASVNGYMTSTYASKLDGIATGATANVGTVTSVSGTGTVSGLTLTGSVTSSGSLTLGGTLSLAYSSLSGLPTLGTASSMTGPSGTIVGTTDTQTISNKTVTGLKETKVASSSYNFDLSSGNYFTHTASANNLTVSNVPATGTVGSFIIELTNGGAYTFSFWSGVKWAGGTSPTLTSSGIDILGFYTHDGGTTWRGLVLARDSK